MRSWLMVSLFGAMLFTLGCGGGGGSSGGGASGNSGSGGSSSTQRVDGACSRLDVNSCLSGAFADVLDTDTEHRWNCEGSGGGTTAMCSIEKSEICTNGAADADNPLICVRGELAINGIDRIPLDQIKATNKDMQRMFVIADTHEQHILGGRAIASESYVTLPDWDYRPDSGTRITKHAEGDIETTIGLLPFTEILDLSGLWDSWTVDEIGMMGTVKIANYSVGGDSATATIGSPHAWIYSAGNEGHNASWPDEFWTLEQREAIADEIAADKLLFVAGFARGVRSNYIRHGGSSSCKDVDDGCLWAPYVLRDTSGTSLSAPNVSSALASVLSVFPDTEHQDLVRLTRACAKKTGEGIDGEDGLLATSGGFGVADFSCMDEIVTTAANLSEGQTATLTVDGREVTVSPRALVVVEPE